MRTDATFQSILQYHRVLRGKYLPHVRKRGKLRGFNVQGCGVDSTRPYIGARFFQVISSLTAPVTAASAVRSTSCG